LPLSAVQGKIVVYNVPFIDAATANNTDMFHHYSIAVAYRVKGASEAAKRGAVASLVRSMTPVSQSNVHTGNMRYEDGVNKIPAGAITVEDAEYLHRVQRTGGRIQMKLVMTCETRDDVESYNVIAELVGREFPEQVVVVGGHIDSWVCQVIAMMV
jgi:carboxypeptidase Q